MIGNASGVSAFGFPFRALTTVDINSQKVFKDEAFSWGKRFLIPSSAVGGGIYDILIDPRGIDAEKACVILPVSLKAMDAGPIYGDLYINPTITGGTGTVIPGGNRLGTSPTTPKTIVTLAPTVTDPGTKAPGSEFTIMSNGIAAVASFGGQAKEDLILVANKSLTYMFRLVNQEANTARGHLSMTLFEAEVDV